MPRYFVPAVHRALIWAGVTLVVAAFISLACSTVTANHRAAAERERACRHEVQAIQARAGLMVDRYLLPANHCIARDYLIGRNP